MKSVSLFLISIFLLIFSSCSNNYKKGIGMTRERIFIDCPDTPNCVSSTLDKSDKRYIEPLEYKGDVVIAKNKLKAILEKHKTWMLVEESNTYMHLEVRSFMFRFIDDVEFYFPKNKKKIYMKSGARVGYIDFGVNRRRLEKIRDSYND